MEDSERERSYWAGRVLEKIGMWRQIGADFQHTFWVFDWDTNKPDTANIENYGKECRALIELSTTGTIHIKLAIPLTEQNRRYPEINKHGIDLPFSMDAAGNAGRNTGWYRAYWITGFDYDRYLARCEAFGIRPEQRRSAPLSYQQPLNTDTLRVTPKSYDSASHILVLAGIRIPLSHQPKREKGSKQVELMSLLFSVKYFSSGVGLSHIYPVKDRKKSTLERKKARALLAAINDKLPEELEGQELIKFDGIKFYIDNRYTKN